MRSNPERFNQSREPVVDQDLFRAHLEQDTPGSTWQKFTEKQFDPKLAGAIAAAGTLAVLSLDMMFNGASNLATSHPEIVPAGAAAIGALAHKLVRDANAKELSDAHRATREQQKGENQW